MDKKKEKDIITIPDAKFWYYIGKYNERFSDSNGVEEVLYKGKDKPEYFMERFTEEDCKARPWGRQWQKLRFRNSFYRHSFKELVEITFEEYMKYRDFGFFFDDKVKKFNKDDFYEK